MWSYVRVFAKMIWQCSLKITLFFCHNKLWITHLPSALAQLGSADSSVSGIPNTCCQEGSCRMPSSVETMQCENSHHCRRVFLSWMRIFQTKKAYWNRTSQIQSRLQSDWMWVFVMESGRAGENQDRAIYQRGAGVCVDMTNLIRLWTESSMR